MKLITPVVKESTDEELNEFLFGCRDHWTDVIRCAEVVIACDSIEMECFEEGRTVPLMLESTRYEANLRGRSLMQLSVDID